MIAGLHRALGQRGQHHCIRHARGGFGERLQKRQIRVVGSTGIAASGLKLPQVRDRFIEQHHRRPVLRQQRCQHILARRGSFAIRGSHQRVAIFLAELPGQLAPQRLRGDASVLARFRRGQRVAVEHRDIAAHQILDLGLVQKLGDAEHLLGGDLATGDVIDRQHGVRLAAAERSLKLHDRLAAFAR